MMRPILKRIRRSVWLLAAVPLMMPGSARGADAGAAPQAARVQLNRLIMRLVPPLFQPAPPGKAWLCEVRAKIGKNGGRILVAWDAGGRQAVRLDVPKYGAAQMAFTPEQSWLFVPKYNVLFYGKPVSGVAVSAFPTVGCTVWPRLKALVGAGAMGALVASWPKDLRLERTPDNGWHITDAKGKYDVRIEGKPDAGPIRFHVLRPTPAEITIAHWEQVDAARLTALTARPAAPGKEQKVDDRELRVMLRTLTDMLAEAGLFRIKPRLAPNHFPGLPEIQGKHVVVFRGTPAEIGKQHGTLLRTAVRDNVNRVLHGVGLVKTVLSGKWLPGELKATWERQRKWIPDDLVAEIDAMADAAGVPRDWAHWTNVYPEMFHCSGLAMRGAATKDGRLLHGRILDYGTEVGFQTDAVIMVFAPKGRNAWVNIGYAGCVGSVTAMNVKGLAMGEMGGGGEGYVDGMPMMFLVREVMERFDNVRDAVRWIRSVPRTCEYFYVLSCAKGKDMVGLASWARELARIKGVPDLQVVEPGAAHPLLPRPVKDCVLMSAGKRYQNLVDRVRQYYGKITPAVAWKIMGKGVAMHSCLHIALFMPETLDFEVADAGLRAEPAYTQPAAHFNLRHLLAKPEVTLPGPKKGN